MSKARILAVDDQRYFRELTEGILDDAGYDVQTASSGEQALHILERDDFDIVLTDLVMPGIDGADLVGRIKERRPDQDVIMLTGAIDVTTAVEAMKQGAIDYILKPFDREVLTDSIEKILRQRQLHAEHARLMEENLEFMGVLTLFERAAGLFSTLSIEPLAERLIEGLCLETRAQSGVLWATEKPGGKTLHLVGARGLVRLDGEPETVGLQEFISAWCPSLAAGRSAVTSLPEDVNAVEALYVPLQSAGVMIGVARLTDKLDDDHFGESDRAVAEKVCEFGSVALNNAMRFQALERRSLRDPRTNAYTRAYFEDAVRNEIQKAKRFSHRFSILRIEVESPDEGDDDALEIAQHVAAALRNTDLLASDDHDLFFLLMPQTDALGAGILGERIRRSVASLGKGEARSVARFACVSFPVDGNSLESLTDVLEARAEESRSGLLATRNDLAEDLSLDQLFDRLLELGDVQPVELEGQILRFVLEDNDRRAGDRGILILSPGTRWLADISETLQETCDRATQTEIIVLAEGAPRRENAQITWISKSTLDSRRPFLFYYGEGPAFAMIGSATDAGSSVPIFQTAEHGFIERLAFELQRELGILISV